MYTNNEAVIVIHNQCNIILNKTVIRKEKLIAAGILILIRTVYALYSCNMDKSGLPDIYT